MKEKVRNFIKGNVMYEENVVINDSDDIFETGIVSSLFSMKLITFIEKEFKLEVDYADMNLDNFNTVDNICTYISRKTEVENA